MRNNKKGFTLVELVIVIAVIAILAAVLLPTFAGIVKRANLSAVTQRAEAVRREVLAQYYDSTEDMLDVQIIVNQDRHNYTYTINEYGKFVNTDASTLKSSSEEDLAAKISTIGANNWYKTYDNVLVIIPKNYTANKHVRKYVEMHFAETANINDSFIYVD